MPADDAWLADRRPVRRVVVRPDAEIARETWPAVIPAVSRLLDDGGLELPAGVTFLVGENGSGKSTLLEAIAVAAGLPPEGGSNQGSHATRPSESPLAGWLSIERSPGAPRWGFFLRAETMHGYYSYLESLPGSPDTDIHEMSHGESFNALRDRKLDNPRYPVGFACLDEPEAALSFDSQLAWIASLADMVARGGQVVCATHSPLLTALPGARILELGEWGYRETAWDELELVAHWRSYLEDPRRYLRHLLD